METVADFIFLDSKITADGNCSHEIKRHLLLRRKVMTNLDNILKSRDITLPTKVHLVKAMVFPVVMYRCELNHKERWVLKNWCFWTVVLEKTLESPLACKEIQPVHPKGNQSWIFIERADAKGENSNTLATWCKELSHLKRPWCWEWLKAGGEGDGQKMKWDGWLNGHELDVWELVMDRVSWHCAVHGVAKCLSWLSIVVNWTEYLIIAMKQCCFGVVGNQGSQKETERPWC